MAAGSPAGARGTDRAAAQAYEAARTADKAVRAVQRGVRNLNSAVDALASAQQIQARQAYELAKATVDALTLRAPIGGVVRAVLHECRSMDEATDRVFGER
ncbi:hypothetical protein GA0074704_0022 [Micromonospora siamensis]|uniref:Uncharacterized protein n=1 Tax=Micromonospora siamensis TaxID=299152 RepID=A0A1C5GK91_9ACTN|nr:hypothetical protein [Micromonospora siamensis]SCG34224.1 hypothetical protein GA0074704_0022 [Micromonospora siamensis]